MLSSQVYVVVGTQIIFPGVHFSHAIVMKHIIHFIIFAQCTLHFFVWIIMQMNLMVIGTI